MDVTRTTGSRRLLAAVLVVAGFAACPLPARADLLVSRFARDHNTLSGRAARPVAAQPAVVHAPAGADADDASSQPPAGPSLLRPLQLLALTLAIPPPTFMATTIVNTPNSPPPPPPSPPMQTWQLGGPGALGDPFTLPPPQMAPEPGSLMTGLVGSVLGGLFALTRRRRAACATHPAMLSA